MEHAINTVSKMCSDLKQMPYYKNYAAASGKVHNISNHEDAVKDVIIQNGFSEFALESTKDKKKRTNLWIEHPEFSDEMPINTFISQPCGTHESPDFIIKISASLILAMECKSSTKEAPLYNSGGLTSNYLYVFSSQKYNQSTIYMGSDIITPEQQLLIDAHIKESRERDLILNKKLMACDTRHRGISFYTRPMINQTGGKTYCDYFTHEYRQSAEENVMNYFVEKIMTSSVSTEASMEASMEASTDASSVSTDASMEASSDASMDALVSSMEALAVSTEALKTPAKEFAGPVPEPETKKTTTKPAKKMTKDEKEAAKIAIKEGKKTAKTAAMEATVTAAINPH